MSSRQPVPSLLVAALVGTGLCLTALMPTVVGAADDRDSPLYEGAYIAPMASYVYTNDDRTDDGFGGVVGAGYRLGWYAIELSGVYADVSADRGSVQQAGGGLNGLVFPFDRWPNAFFLIGAGGLENQDYPTIDAGGLLTPDRESSKTFSTTTIQGGGGYIFPLKFKRYAFGVRAEALYRYGHREFDVRPDGEPDVPNDFNDVLVNVGLQLPFGLLEKQEEPKSAEPVAVVAPPPPPPDSDGDGVTDRLDQCPETPPNTEVDDVGCPLPPPCKTPEPGERISLAGCGLGDKVTLRGVNFEFNKSTLTPNAKTLLDDVAAELNKYPDIEVELSGHTDSLGRDSYNQQLSESRAKSVRDYLMSAGVDSSRMSVVGYGEERPVADNETEDGRALNRRTELEITAGVATVRRSPAAAAVVESPSADEDAPPMADDPASEDDSGMSADDQQVPATDSESDELDFLDF